MAFEPDHEPQDADDHRTGRDGPNAGDDLGGEGSEFAGDAIAAEDDKTEEDGAAWFAAHGTGPDDT